MTRPHDCTNLAEAKSVHTQFLDVSCACHLLLVAWTWKLLVKSVSDDYCDIPHTVLSDP